MQTDSSSYWSGIGQDLVNTALDYGRVKLLDTTNTVDDQNLPDNADLYYGYGDSARNSRNAAGFGGMSVTEIVVLIGVLVIGAIVVKKAMH